MGSGALRPVSRLAERTSALSAATVRPSSIVTRTRRSGVRTPTVTGAMAAEGVPRGSGERALPTSCDELRCPRATRRYVGQETQKPVAQVKAVQAALAARALARQYERGAAARAAPSPRQVRARQCGPRVAARVRRSGARVKRAHKPPSKQLRLEDTAGAAQPLRTGHSELEHWPSRPRPPICARAPPARRHSRPMR
jgi:hypothetical protein